MSETTRKKKLIEVALPLDEINAACKADKEAYSRHSVEVQPDNG